MLGLAMQVVYLLYFSVFVIFFYSPFHPIQYYLLTIRHLYLGKIAIDWPETTQ